MTDSTIWVSITHAATLANVSRQTIYNWLAAGTLLSDHIAGRLVVRKTSLANHKRAE